MKILEINSMPVGSTGKIMFDIGECAKKKGMDVCYAYPEFDAKAPENHKNDSIIIGNKTGQIFSHILGRLTGYNDCFARQSTIQLLETINEFQPDIIHLHNLHNCYLNIKLLFQYFKEHDSCVIWTLHDCWSFTGGCAYFDMAKCKKWKNQCYRCQQINKYPKSYVDRSNQLFNIKKEAFLGVKRMVLVTPSEWLAGLVRESFLKNNSISVIHNGIDLNIFRVSAENIRKELDIKDKLLLLGSAFRWDERKGLQSFIKLSQILDSRYQILLIGVDDKLKMELPSNIMTLPRISVQKQLAQYYTAADIFINPTLEDNYPTTNLEAIACGTPVVTYNTGGSPESVTSEVGKVVEQNDIYALAAAIKEVAQNLRWYSTNCLRNAETHGRDVMLKEYLDLYYSVINKEKEGNI